MGYIYKITNLINNKIYIGKTTAENPTRRWTEHKSKANKSPRTPIEFAIKKYGYQNFKFEPILKSNNKNLPKLETKNILKYNTLSPNGYNLEIYQPNRILTKISIEKMSKSNQGKLKSKNKTSKYVGVYKDRNSIHAELRHRNIKYKKAFSSEIKASIAYDKMVLFLYGNEAIINHKNKRNKWSRQNLKNFYIFFIKKTSKEESNLYYDPKRKKWQARLRFNNKTFHLGRFKSKKEAIKAKIKKMKELKIYDTAK